MRAGAAAISWWGWLTDRPTDCPSQQPRRLAIIMRAAKRWSCGREQQADEQENCALGKRRLDGPVPQRGCSSPPGDDCRKFLGSQGLLDLARSAPDFW